MRALTVLEVTRWSVDRRVHALCRARDLVTGGGSASGDFSDRSLLMGVLRRTASPPRPAASSAVVVVHNHCKFLFDLLNRPNADVAGLAEVISGVLGCAIRALGREKPQGGPSPVS